ncbi:MULTISPECIES: hypothetical protein [Providencia]|uniref:Uncharacterized protein n=2 Tax=Providencia TaxID=586 RepID=A0ABU2J300_9GAMM|nr:hypothetical protein [Providencia huaxiensis]ELR5094349.1 hypothetical protein [Providencia rettgeri]MDI9095009.1 hypothetical protein [Providencia rettgeri]MDT0135707.1 hypothetical protein [Providencia huaxiensis]MDT1982112.1 hypothetical protein [Providencia huaxiensis]
MQFTPEAQAIIPEKSSGLIYPVEQGFAITDKSGVPRLLVISDEGSEFCWFVSGQKKAGKYRLSITTDEDEKEFGIDGMVYEDVISLATRIYRKCQKYLAEYSAL